MEERKSKNKVIAAFAVMISMIAGIFATLLCLPAKNTAFAAETFDPANVSKAYKVAEVGDYLDKLYIRNIPNSVEFNFKKNTTENFVDVVAKFLSFPLLRMNNSKNDKTIVYASSYVNDEFHHYLVIMDTTKYNEQRSKYASALGDKDDGYFVLALNGFDKVEDYEAYDLSSSANIHTIDLYERYQIFQSYDWVTSYETSIIETLEPSMCIALHNLLFVEDPDYTPESGGSSGGSGSQGGSESGGNSGGSGSQGGSESGGSSGGDDGSQGGNESNTPKFTLDKVGYICIGVTAISAAVVIMLNRRKKNKTKE